MVQPDGADFLSADPHHLQLLLDDEALGLWLHEKCAHLPVSSFAKMTATDADGASDANVFSPDMT